MRRATRPYAKGQAASARSQTHRSNSQGSLWPECGRRPLVGGTSKASSAAIECLERVRIRGASRPRVLAAVSLHENWQERNGWFLSFAIESLIKSSIVFRRQKLRTS